MAVELNKTLMFELHQRLKLVDPKISRSHVYELAAASEDYHSYAAARMDPEPRAPNRATLEKRAVELGYGPKVVKLVWEMMQP